MDTPTVPDLLRAAVAAIGGTERAGQVRMAEAVAEAIESNRHLIVQAGTGTGKSLAYLVPVLAQDARVVVATATIALQNQLVGRDLPRLVGAVEPLLDHRPSHAILKGRRNYACLQKLRDGDAEEGPTLFDATATSRLGKEVVRLRRWAQASKTGDRDEVVPGVSDRAWAQVSVTAQDCLGAHRCPYGKECFAERAREAARDADIVVTNHALLAIDALEPLPVFGEHDVVVVDEAHELTDRVTNAATDELRSPIIERAVRRAARHVKNARPEALSTAGARLDHLLRGLPEGRLDDLPAELAAGLAEVRDTAHPLVTELAKDSSARGLTEALRQRARLAVEEVHEVADRLLAHEDHDVTWVEVDAESGRSLKVAPLTVASLLRRALFGERTVVLTSATLALGGNFDILARQVGLELGEAAAAVGPDASVDPPAAGPPAWSGLDVGSPFDYRRQGILYVARKLPPPGRDGIAAATLDELAALVEAAGGRTLGLFSSHRAAVAAAEAMRSRLSAPVLLQGEDATAALVGKFAADVRTCLFGTLSLWQGVDVPGPACQLVVIDRIPFPRPDDPVRSARQKAVDEAGGNGFMTVSAAHAALMLAQGAGRLIRTSADRGVVAVLDSRLSTARYAGFLRASLPHFWYTEDGDQVRRSLTAINLSG